jgi:Na+/H+-dicarboxylate symporter
MKTPTFTKQILIGMLFGIIIGAILHPFSETTFIQAYVTNGVLDIAGDLFIQLMKMLVVPLIFISIICGASNLSEPKMLGRIGGKTILLYMCTTAIAVSLAMTFALIFHIGEGANLQTNSDSLNLQSSHNFRDTFLGLFTTNPFQALAEGNILQVIVFALLVGFGISFSGEPGLRLKQFFEDSNQVIMKMVSIILYFTPFGVFALLAKLMITTEPEKILHLLGYFCTVAFVLILHLILVNSIIIGLLSRLNPVIFFKQMFPAQLFAFSTSSSNASIPVTLSTVTKKLGVDNKIAGFTIPLGATINMDGTAIMQGVATIFIANIYNIDIGLFGYLIVILTATMCSIGTAGVPGIGLITLTMVLQQVGLPVEGIALIIGVDRILDMLRTAVNVTGDASITTFVARSENCLDLNSYNRINTNG